MSWQSDFVDANGLKMHYTRTGGDKPPFVLAHGFSDDGLCWTPVARELENDYDVVMVDARSHGRSDDPPEGYGNADQADDLAAAIRALKLEKPLVLGHSMGAMTTLTMAARYPDLPGAILLEDPPSWWIAPPASTGTANEQWRDRTRSRIIGLKRKTFDELIAQQRAEAPGWSEEELVPWANSKLRLSFNVLNRQPTGAVDWASFLAQVSCPTLLITADIARGAIVDAKAAQALRALIPQLQIAEIPEAGHSIRRDQFGRYMAVVRAFVSDLAAGQAA